MDPLNQVIAIVSILVLIWGMVCGIVCIFRGPQFALKLFFRPFRLAIGGVLVSTGTAIRGGSPSKKKRRH